MQTFENFDQNKYDRLKIFLISNFNLVFNKSLDLDTVESFEITTADGKIAGDYQRNLKLVLHSHDEKSQSFSKIINKIKEIAGSDSTKTTISSDQSAQEALIMEYAKNSKKFYDHILGCEECRKKLAQIWGHLYS